MFRAAQLAAFFLAWGTLMVSAAPAERRVYKVDSVIATARGGSLTIAAKGAVQTGGWRKPRLRVLRGMPSEPRAVVVEFLAAPPPPGMTVIQGLVPVQASVHIPLRPHAGSVRVVAEANEVTSQVLHGLQ